MTGLGLLQELLSWHYQVEAGASILTEAGAQVDQVLSAAKLAVRARYPDLAPDQALPHIGDTFNLAWPARFTAAAARALLAERWSIWEEAGTRARLVKEIQRLGYPQVGIVTYRDLVNLGQPPTVFGGISSFYYVIIRKPNPWLPPGKWGDGQKWGGGSHWGSTATWAEIEELRRVILKFGRYGCRFIEVWLQVNLLGFPVRWTRWPVNELWEQSTTGAWPNFYNYSY